MSKKYFTRKRKLTFFIVILLILGKSVKSLQLVLNEVFVKLAINITVCSASAFVQARVKLSHKAFIELNQKAVVDNFYMNGDYKTYHGFRLLAVDGSKVILPNEENIKDYFGSINIANQIETTTGEYPVALASVLYDVLNNICLDSILGKAKAYEVDLAIRHLYNYSKLNDLLTFDRNYPSYMFIATLLQNGINFCGRCSRSSFKEARMMFTSSQKSKVVTLRPRHSKIKEIEALGLPLEIKVRFVRVVLDTGEVEILITSLLDNNLYPAKDFKELYYLRWGIETFYGTIKGRLNLENFSGKSVEAVKQDFYATVFISGLESILILDAQGNLDSKTSNKYPQAVNKAVSFNAIKNNLIELFYKEDNVATILEKLTLLFMTKPECRRKGRIVPRSKAKVKNLLNYYKRKKKICF